MESITDINALFTGYMQVIGSCLIDGKIRLFLTEISTDNDRIKHPIHLPDLTGLLNGLPEEGSVEDVRAKGREQGVKSRQEKSRSKQEQIPAAFDAVVNEAGKAAVEDMAEYLDVSEKTMRNYLKKQSKFIIRNGFVVENEEL